MFGLLQKKIITKTERQLMLDWIYRNEPLFIPNPNGPYRKYFLFSDYQYIPKLFFEIKNRIIQIENITNWKQEPMYQDYIGWVSDGGFIHEHKDHNVNDLKHVRYNLFLSVPRKGGDPVYNGRYVRFSERSYVKCNSGDEFHSCKPVIGPKPRIVVSYGFLTPDPIHTKL